MRKFIGLMLLLGLFSLAAVAQENYSKAEVFGGYQYTRFDGGVNANGFNGALTGNLNHWFGVAAVRTCFVRRISLFGFGQWHLGQRQRLCLYAGRWRGCESCSGYLGALAPV